MLAIIIWLVLPFFLFCISFILFMCIRNICDDRHFWGIMGSWIFGFILFFILLIIAVNRIDVRANIKEFISVEITLENYQSKSNEYERAAIAQKAIEMNRWLANTKFYANHDLFWIFYPPQIKDLEPIK